ncbi:MAG: choice-of-anchor B family protein, partial [Gemmatimonadetes bacterium]|nr:choice-of-anchor B family protein [Gemmatimonadota bacterium]
MMRSHFPRGSRSFCFGVALAASLLAPGAASAQVFDFDNMVLLARRDLYTGYNDVWGFVGNDGHEYVIQGTTTGTAWWDIDDPMNPVQVKFIPGAGSVWRDMFTIGDYCYVGTEGGGGIQIIDISDPTDPTLVNTYTATVNRCHNVFGDPDRHLVFVIGGFTTMTNGGVQILDATDPVNLVEIGRWDNQYIHDLSVENDKMYVCLINTGRFRIIDYTDATNPTNFGTGWLDPTGSVHASWPVGDGQYVMIAEETTGGRVKKLDISNPNAIFAAAEHNPAPQASPHNVHVQGDKTYVSWYARGTRVLDNDLNELGYWDTYPDTNDGGVGPGNWGVYPHLPSGVIAANDGKYGLFLLRYDPDAAVFDGTISSSAGQFVGAPEVELIGYGVTQETESYKFSAFPGAAQIRASAFGHVEQTVNVSVGAGGTTTTNITLTKLPSGGVSGTITDSVSHLPLADVEVALAGTPVWTTTDGTGVYSFPDVPSGAYSLTVARYGYDVPAAMPLTVSTGVLGTLDVELDPAFFYEDFSAPVGWTVQ